MKIRNQFLLSICVVFTFVINIHSQEMHGGAEPPTYNGDISALKV